MKFALNGTAHWGFTPITLSESTGQQILFDNCGNIISSGSFRGGKAGSSTNAIIHFDNIIAKSVKSFDYYLAKYCQAKIKQKIYCGLDVLEAECESYYNSFKREFEDGQILTGKKVNYIAPFAGWYKVKLTMSALKGCHQTINDSLYFELPLTNLDTPVILGATVSSPTTVNLTFKSLLPAKKYNIYRSQTGNNYQLIGSTRDTFYSDSSLDCKNFSYTYKLSAEDFCGNTVEAISYAKTILLQGENHNNQYAEIKWSPYEHWKEGVKEYCIEIKDTAGNWNALNCNQNNNLALKDDDFVDVNNKERCYRIRALENNGNNQQSLSNELCLPYLPTIWIPNAFSPNNDGLNDTFKILTIALAEYKLTIYNCWGQQVFTSDDLNKNWTGKSGNENLPEGEYIYTLQAKGFNKENIYKQGYILLIR